MGIQTSDFSYAQFKTLQIIKNKTFSAEQPNITTTKELRFIVNSNRLRLFTSKRRCWWSAEPLRQKIFRLWKWNWIHLAAAFVRSSFSRQICGPMKKIHNPLSAKPASSSTVGQTNQESEASPLFGSSMEMESDLNTNSRSALECRFMLMEVSSTGRFLSYV